MNDQERYLPTRQVHIVYLGEAGFPIGLGAVQRMTLVGKSLLNANCSVTVLCRKGVLRKSNNPGFDISGSFEGIDYKYLSDSVFRPEGFLKRNFVKLKGMIGEFKYLFRLKKTNNITAAIISNHSTLHVLRYKIYSLLIGFPLVLNFVELASAMKGREGFLVKINDRIFDKHIVRIVDGALPISEKLESYYNSISPTKPSLKLPILCDFEKFKQTSRSKTDTIFLYCGAASYFELVEFVLDAFDQLNKPDKHVFLELILGGDVAELKKVNQRIEKANNKEQVKITTNVSHDEIPRHYCNASALLIPLRPTPQDEARFPHKIGEYLASGRPMITTAYGEINHYDFIDGETALVADDYNIESFAEKMRYILKHPQKSKEIGVKGRQMGLDNFDYSKHGQKLMKFLTSFNRKN